MEIGFMYNERCEKQKYLRSIGEGTTGNRRFEHNSIPQKLYVAEIGRKMDITQSLR